MSAFRAFRHCDDDDEEEAGAEKKEEKDENNDDDDRFVAQASHSTRNPEFSNVQVGQFQSGRMSSDGRGGTWSVGRTTSVR